MRVPFPICIGYPILPLGLVVPFFYVPQHIFPWPYVCLSPKIYIIKHIYIIILVQIALLVFQAKPVKYIRMNAIRTLILKSRIYIKKIF